MKTAAQRRDPVTHVNIPVWCHKHGSKMDVEQLDRENHVLIISGSAAKVTIRKASTVFPDAEGWFVDWEVVQCRPRDEGVRGRSFFNKKNLEAAFGLSEDSDKFDNWFFSQHGVDAAEQGKYIRWKHYLNIPCPGTGHDGDPNVSIHLDERIQNAVRRLIE